MGYSESEIQQIRGMNASKKDIVPLLDKYRSQAPEERAENRLQKMVSDHYRIKMLEQVEDIEQA